MTIRKHLEAILEGAAQRPADRGDQKAAPEKIEDDITKQGGMGGDSGRPADKSDKLEVKENPTNAKTETDKVENGAGTEVQGNTSEVMKGMGESISEKLSAALAESAEFKIDLDGVKGLLESQELSEDFQTQAVELVEAVIGDIAKAHIAKIEEAAAQLIESELESKVELIESEVDSYLNHVVAEWMEENKLAVETGIKTQVAESFMAGLTELLEAHNVELPEESVDLYEAAIDKGQELVDLYEAAIEAGEKIMSENVELRKQLALTKLIEGATETQAEKLTALAESVEFESEEAFIEKMTALKEGYVKAKVDTEALTEDADGFVEQTEQKQVSESVDPQVAQLASVVGKFARK